MRHLITIFIWFSLVCLGAWGAYAEALPPAGIDIIDFVNVGEAASEAGHLMAEWSHEFDADAEWGFSGNSAYYREIWGPSNPWNGMPVEDSLNWAEIDLDFTQPPASGQRNIGFFFLGGASDDNFYVYIDGTLIGEVTETQTSNTMVREYLAVPEWVTDGVHTVKLECSEPPGDLQSQYGQVTVDEVYTFTQGPAITPIVADAGPINCDGSKVVNFHYTPDDAPPVRGYSVRVQSDTPLIIEDYQGAYLDLSDSDIAMYDVATGGTLLKQVIQITPGHVYDIDYAIGGATSGITSEADLFSMRFHGDAHGPGTVEILSVKFRELDNTPIPGVVFSGIASIDVDCAAPTGTFVINPGDPAYTNSENVNLQLSVLGATEMRFSNDGTGWAGPEDGWVSIVTPYPWVLSSGDGPKTVEGEFRDAAGNVLAYSDGIELDKTASGPVTALTATRGHNKITLSWTNPGDATAVEVWHQVWHDGTPGQSAYPEYGDVNPTVPPRLADRQAVIDSGIWVLVYSGPVPGTPFVDGLITPLDRGIYYYEVFVQDAAGNWSDRAADYKFAISYLLGDLVGFGVPDPDGKVLLGDIDVLGAAYGTVEADGSPPYNNECDVGPTDDFSGAGIPTTDSAINFEDMMIFALNWDEEVTKTRPAAGGMIARFSWVKVDDTTWSLVLAEPCANLKGLNLKANLPQDGVLSLTAGELLGQQGSTYFLRNIPRNGLDAGLALMGPGVCIVGQGELVRIEMAREFDSGDIEITARDSANKDLEYNIEEAEVGSDTPTSYMVSANYPNPFNPSTKIDFALPEFQHVKLMIFGIDGRRIATLKNESMAAGHYTVTWMGRDDQGELVASGIYFYRIQAGDFSRIQKMTLLK